MGSLWSVGALRDFLRRMDTKVGIFGFLLWDELLLRDGPGPPHRKPSGRCDAQTRQLRLKVNIS